MENKRLEVTGTGLKVIAVVTMLIDHIAFAAQVNGIFDYYYPVLMAKGINPQLLYWIMRGIGRLAFPIYCYLLVEGFFYSRNLLKYGLRLFATAIFAEIPFDLVLKRQIFDFTSNNVLWELLLGLIVLYVIKSIQNWKEPFAKSNRSTQVAKVVAVVTAIALGMILAQVLGLDYGYTGIACIVTMYLMHSATDKARSIKGFIYGVIWLTALSSVLEIVALIDVVPLFNYQGRRGRDSKALRWFFYLFYPVHLCVLYIVVQIIIN